MCRPRVYVRESGANLANHANSTQQSWSPPPAHMQGAVDQLTLAWQQAVVSVAAADPVLPVGRCHTFPRNTRMCESRRSVGRWVGHRLRHASSSSPVYAQHQALGAYMRVLKPTFRLFGFGLYSRPPTSRLRSCNRNCSAVHVAAQFWGMLRCEPKTSSPKTLDS